MGAIRKIIQHCATSFGSTLMTTTVVTRPDKALKWAKTSYGRRKGAKKKKNERKQKAKQSQTRSQKKTNKANKEPKGQTKGAKKKNNKTKTISYPHVHVYLAYSITVYPECLNI